MGGRGIACHRVCLGGQLTDIGTWLGTLGLEKYASAFLVNEVDLAALAHFSDDDLKELGLPLGPRRKLLAAIKERAAPASSENVSRDAVPTGERRVVAVLF